MWFRKPSSAPLWRDEFSVFTADERYVNRRQFTKFLTLTSLACSSGTSGFWRDRGSTGRRAYPAQAVAAAGRDPGGRREDCSRTRAADDPCILVRTGEDCLRRLQPEMHASLLRRLLRAGAKPAGVPLP